VAGFDITSGFALCIGTFLIFNAFSVSVNRRRRDIGTLRSLGATPRQAQALFLVEAALIGVVGGVLGLLAGAAISQSFLGSMGETTEQVYGVAATGETEVTMGLALQAIALGICASLVGAWGPALTASRILPTEAFSKGSFQARAPRRPLARLVVGCLLLGTAVAVGSHPRFGGGGGMILVLVVGAAGVVFLVGPVTRALLSWIMPVLIRVSPVAGQLSADSLLSNPKRTSGTAMAMTLSLAFVLGLGGYMGSTKASMFRWMDDVLTSDLYVRASANFVRPDFRFPGSLREGLLGVPGVRAVESYRAARLEFRGEPILVASIEIGPLMDRTRQEFLQGNEEAMRRGLVEEGKCAVSDNFFRRFGLGVGDRVELATPSGRVQLPIAVVFQDFSSDRGTVFLDRPIFVELWADDRVDVYDISVAPGADPGQVRDAIRAELAGKMPALISTRREFAAEITTAIDAFYNLVKITVFLAVLVAFLGIVTALLISVVERTREIGILKALGALGPQLRRSVVCEALVIALCALALALPVGNLLAYFMETTVAEHFAGWRMPHRYPWVILGQLLVALPLVSAFAAWVPARQAANVKVTEGIEYE
jgi:putative ABC transport system permease protein